ncbi:MAG TPA: hypothetical protein DDY49_12800 [Paenibacillaceae bacterium]|nr:hypothetical protein [Paenibacillaceae bacterium]
MKSKIFSLLCLSFLLFSVARAAEYKKIEMFHVENEKVVQKIDNTRARQHEILLLINSIDGMYTKAKLDFKKGRVFRIPIEPTVHVENQWYSGLLSEVYLFQPENEKPILLLIDDNNKGHYMKFNKDLQPFIKSLSIP